MMSKHVRYLFLVPAILFVCSLVFSQAQAASNVLFILDASGSMAQKFGDQTKMQAAKDVFKSLLSDLPKDANVGLELYGHHGNKDCSVIEVMDPVAPLDAAAIQANVDKLTPQKGATPIAASLEQGAEALKSVHGDKAIVLISDGKETCGGDPATVAKKLSAKGINITTHVVGLGVKDEEKAQLASIAVAGGGKYYSTNNAEQLKQSLAEIKEEVVKKDSKIIFDEEFNGEFLSDKWNIINPDEDNMIVEDGYLTVLLQPGWPSEGKAKNIVAFTGRLPRSYEVYAKFETEMVDFPSFRVWETQRSGLILYSGKDKFILLTTTTGPVNEGHPIKLAFDKYKKGKWLPGYAVVVSRKRGMATYELKIQKKKHTYTAFFRDAKGDWVSIGTFTDLRGKYKPAIVAFRAPNARETRTNFDRFVITSLE